MTNQRKLKDRIRARMERTGERYTTARRHVLGAPPEDRASDAGFEGAGHVPAVAALRVLVGHHRRRAVASGLSEPMVLGIAGGVGIGVHSFRYEQDDQSSFYLAGRHRWEDDLAYLWAAAERLGFRPRIRETTGSKAARAHLDEALDSGLPAIAWVDMALLPHRAMPASREGSGYHVVTVLRADATEAVVADLVNEPVRMSRADLEAARGRIRKFRHRLMTLDDPGAGFDVPAAVREGIGACVTGLREGRANHTLGALRTWADRLEASGGAHAWATIFPPGRHLWTALVWTYDCIEHNGTGGGLIRPLYADFLREAAAMAGLNALAEAAERYEALGEAWRELADAALPADAPLLGRARALLDEKARLLLDEGGVATERVSGLWSELSDLGRTAAADFPLYETEAADLRADLARRVGAIHADELASLAAVDQARG